MGQVYPVGVQWLRVDGQRVEAHALLTYSETTGDVYPSFPPPPLSRTEWRSTHGPPGLGPRSPPVTLDPGWKCRRPCFEQISNRARGEGR